MEISDSVELKKAINAAMNGDVIVLPTDTVYGIGVKPEYAYKILNLKGRQNSSPILVSSIKEIFSLSENISPYAIKLAKAFLPGALTLVLPINKSLKWNLGSTKETIAIRIPNNKLTLELLEETGPLAVSSANITGTSPSITIAQAKKYFPNGISYFLDGGECSSNVPSTIVSFSEIQNTQKLAKTIVENNVYQISNNEQITILREGAISTKRIMQHFA